MLKKILIALVVVFILIQFFRPTKNISGNSEFDISTRYSMTPEVKTLLTDACYNCHSNSTAYPWYAEVQPAAWWLANHVREGKQRLNFSEFTNRRIAWQNHKLEETIEMIEEKEMPLTSYTWFGMHKEAKLSDTQRQVLISWAKAQMDTLKANFPADSLVMQKRK